MTTIQENELVPFALDGISDHRRLIDGETGPHSRRGLSAQGRENSLCDLVLPVNDSIDVEKAVNHSITIAKRYNARIVLVYVTQQMAVPEEYVQYAKVERIRDYASTYFESLGGRTIARLRRRIEEEGVECTSYTHIGSLADALRSSQESARVVMLVLSLPKKSGIFRTGGFKLSMMSNLKVPVLLVPF